MPDVEDPIVIPKKEDFRDGSPNSSTDSAAEADAALQIVEDVNPDPVVPVKRKGGRKPIYATSEERKQRNRQAQAAFRERRTEYIKQLEETIKHQEDSLQSLQQSHRTAADECLMLRYKNSLLERILMEKGIDVQAELGRKEAAQSSRPTHTLPRPVPIARPQSRHIARLSADETSLMSKTMQSPNALSSPSSRLSSPIKSPGYGGSSIPYQSPRSVQSKRSRASARSTLKSIAPNPGPGPGHWPSPFQSHNEQLEQEYGNHHDMIDADEQPEDTGPGPYPQPFPQQTYSMAPQGFAIPATTEGGRDGFTGSGSGPGDPMVQDDPFGLTASMHFPTPFTFHEGSMVPK